MLLSSRAFPALQPGAAPKGTDLDTFAIAQAPGEPTARACLAACLELATSGETQTPAGRKLFDELAEAVGVMHPQTAKALTMGLQLAERDEDNDYLRLRNRDCLKTGECRKLTSGEIALSMTVFGTNIPYESVRVYRRNFLPLQPENVLMSPDGNIYGDEDGTVYSDDYSSTDFGQQAHFIHEMAHVWQVRTKGINLKLRAPFESQYAYTIEPGKRFLDYKVEQQAAIAGDYFRLLHGQPLRHGQSLNVKSPIDVYRKLLPFVLNEVWK